MFTGVASDNVRPARSSVRLKMKDIMCFLRRTTIGLKTKYKRKYIVSTQLYYPNSIKTFRLIAVCGDVKLKAWIQDRGKETTSTNTNTKEKKQRCKYPCDDCLKPVRNNQNAILCTECTQWYHIRCTGISLKLFQSYYLTPITKKIGVSPAVHCRNCRSLSLMILSRLITDRNQRQIQITRYLTTVMIISLTNTSTLKRIISRYSAKIWNQAKIS